MDTPKREKVQKFCRRCQKALDISSFYLSLNTDKYPDGHLDLCKMCCTAHVDSWDPKTFLWILQEVDVPFVPDEWNKILAKVRNKTAKPGSVVGLYIARMRLKPMKDFRWKDNQFLQDRHRLEIKTIMEQQGFTAAEIQEQLDKATFPMPSEHLNMPEDLKPNNNPSVFSQTGAPEDFFEKPSDDEMQDILGIEPEDEEPAKSRAASKRKKPAMVANNYVALGGYNNEEATRPQSVFESPIETHEFDDILTEEDKIYLRLKWGKSYTWDECVALESLFEQMMNSYDITSAGHIDTLKLLCKTSLKSNQYIDIGDIESFSRMSRTYDTLMKSGNFTAAQNKVKGDDEIDSVGEIVALCEKEGFIPQYYHERPNDYVDETIKDMQEYTRKLVTDEMHLGDLIENSIRIMLEQENKQEDEDVDDDALVLDQIEQDIDDDYDTFSDLDSSIDDEDFDE